MSTMQWTGVYVLSWRTWGQIAVINQMLFDIQAVLKSGVFQNWNNIAGLGARSTAFYVYKTLWHSSLDVGVGGKFSPYCPTDKLTFHDKIFIELLSDCWRWSNNYHTLVYVSVIRPNSVSNHGLLSADKLNGSMSRLNFADEEAVTWRLLPLRRKGFLSNVFSIFAFKLFRQFLTFFNLYLSLFEVRVIHTLFCI